MSRMNNLMRAGLTNTDGAGFDEESSASNKPKLTAVGLCDHCGLIELNKTKSECPEGYALFWERLSDKDLKVKQSEFKKIATAYNKQK